VKLKNLNQAASYYFHISGAAENTNRSSRYENHIKDILGDKSINDIDHDEVQYLITTLQKKDLSDQYIDNMIAMLKSIMNKAATKDLSIRIHPSIKSVKKLYKSNEINKTFTKDQLQELFKAAHKKSDQLGTIVELLYYTGARPKGLLSLVAADVDFHDNTITFPSMKGAGSYQQPMRKETADLLRKHIEKNNIRPSQYLFVVSEGSTREHAMTYNELATRTNILFKPFNINVPKGAKYNKKRLTLYSLRHTIITEMVQVMSPAVVQKYINHSILETTQKYINIGHNEVQSALDNL